MSWRSLLQLPAKLIKFANNLLSDNHQVSLKRFIALLAFGMLCAILIVASKKDVGPNSVSVLNNGLKYLAWIVGVGILGVAATDIFSKKE